jgi:hypothetical protein
MEGDSASPLYDLVNCPKFLLNVSARLISYSPVLIATVPNPLREFPNGPVNSQSRLRIRFFQLPFNGFLHYQPPPVSYTGLVALTATKC